MTAPDVPLKNLRRLSERVRPPLCIPLDIGLAPTIFWSSTEVGAITRSPVLALIPMGDWCGSVP